MKKLHKMFFSIIALIGMADTSWAKTCPETYVPCHLSSRSSKKLWNNGIAEHIFQSINAPYPPTSDVTLIFQCPQSGKVVCSRKSSVKKLIETTCVDILGGKVGSAEDSLEKLTQDRNTLPTPYRGFSRQGAPNAIPQDFYGNIRASSRHQTLRSSSKWDLGNSLARPDDSAFDSEDFDSE